MTDGRKTLLMTTIGGQVGISTLYALAPLRDRIRIVGVNSVAEVPQNFLCDTAYLAPGTADRAAWSARLREILRLERPDLVVAGRDEDLAPLAALKAEAELAGTAFLCPGPASVAVITDKYESWRFSRDRGLPFAETAVMADEVAALIAVHGFPLVAKPRRGTGGKGVRLLRQRSEVDAWLGQGGVAFQPFIGRPEEVAGEDLDPAFGLPLIYVAAWRDFVNVTVTVDLAGRVTYRGSARLASLGRNTARGSKVDDPAIAPVAQACAEALVALDFAGPLTIQGRYDRHGRFTVFEYNGRINGGAYSRGLLGIDELADVVAILLGAPRALAPVAEAEGVLIDRQPMWFRIEPEDLARLRSARHWSKKDA